MFYNRKQLAYIILNYKIDQIMILHLIYNYQKNNIMKIYENIFLLKTKNRNPKKFKNKHETVADIKAIFKL
jgi:hypothetical protein